MVNEREKETQLKDGLDYIKRGLMFCICFSLSSLLPNDMEDSTIIVCKLCAQSCGKNYLYSHACVFKSLR